MDSYKPVSNMSMRRKNEAKQCTIFLEGQFDTVAAAQNGENLLAMLDSPLNAFVIDMGALTYLASAGIRILLLMLKKAKTSGKELQLRALQPMVRDVLEMTGMLQLFKIT
ncbi:MAG: STAS domain-containing protein [Candidatus Omnitrophica bacterium]|nr:STAS domain-containing protein [Candidatus Omnitrophota bacterium]